MGIIEKITTATIGAVMKWMAELRKLWHEGSLAKEQHNTLTRENRIESIKQRIYSEQIRVEGELKTAGKPFVALVIPQEHWNQFFINEKPEEIAEAFWIYRAEQVTPDVDNKRWRPRS